MISSAESTTTTTTTQKKKESKQFFFNRRIYSIARKKEPLESSEHPVNLMTLSGSYGEDKFHGNNQSAGQVYPLEHLDQRNTSLDKLSIVALPEQQRVNSQDYYCCISQENENNSQNGNENIRKGSIKSTSAGRIRSRSNNTGQQVKNNRRQSKEEFKKNRNSSQAEKYQLSQGKDQEGEGVEMVISQRIEQHLKQPTSFDSANKENQDIEYYQSSGLAVGSLVHFQNIDPQHTNNNSNSIINSNNNLQTNHMRSSSSNCWILPNTMCISGNNQQTHESFFLMRTETYDTEQNYKCVTEDSQMQTIMTDGNNQVDQKVIIIQEEEKMKDQRLEGQNQVKSSGIEKRSDQSRNDSTNSKENNNIIINNNQIQLKGGALDYENQILDTQDELQLQFQQPLNKKRHQAYDAETTVHHKTITIDFNDQEETQETQINCEQNQQCFNSDPNTQLQQLKENDSFEQAPKPFPQLTRLCESNILTEQQPQETIQISQQQQTPCSQIQISQSVNTISSQHRSTSSNTKSTNSGESNNCSGEVTSTTARTGCHRGQNYFEFSHLSGLKRMAKGMNHISDDEKEQEQEEDPEIIDMNSLLQGPTVRYSLSNIDVQYRINKESQNVIANIKDNNHNINGNNINNQAGIDDKQIDDNRQKSEQLQKPATFSTTTVPKEGISQQTGKSVDINNIIAGQSHQKHSVSLGFNQPPPLLHTTSMPQLPVQKVQEFETFWKQFKHQHELQQSQKKFSCIDFFLSILPQRLTKQQRDDKLFMLQLAEQPFNDQDSQHSTLIYSVHQSYRKILHAADFEKKYSLQKTHTPKGNYTQREKEQLSQLQLTIPQRQQKQQQKQLVQIRGNNNHNVIVPEQTTIPTTASNTISTAASNNPGLIHLSSVKIHKIREEEQFSKCLKDFQIFSLVQILAFLETARKSCSIGQPHRRLFRKINLILLLVRVSHVVSNKLKEGTLDYAIASLGKQTKMAKINSGGEVVSVIEIVNSLFRAIFFKAVNSILQENLEINQINIKLYQNVEDIANALSNRYTVEEYLNTEGVALA